MILTPQLRQRIEMLQMNSLELSELVQHELESNPVLEEVQAGDEIEEISSEILDQNAEGSADESIGSVSGLNPTDRPSSTVSEEAGSGESAEATSDPFEEIDFGAEFQDYLDPGYRTREYEFKEDGPGFEQFITRGPSLQEYLLWQLGMISLSTPLEEACLVIVGNLDEDGRLSMGDEELSVSSGCTEQNLAKARQIVMQMDPVGCGALDVRECLIAQLRDAEGDNEIAIDLIRNHFSELQPHKAPQLAKIVGLSLEEISKQLSLIKTLDPYPGRRFSSDEPVYIAPEVYIEDVDGEFVIYFPDDGSPRLRISATYQRMLGERGTSKETRDFIKEKVRSAVDLLRNIEHRRQTIYKVVECIVRRQGDFLRHGIEHLKPMMLKDVAEDIGMHLSTISRVVNRKYAHTPQGVIELRKFFSEGMMNEEGEEVSTRILKLKIRKIIEEEDATKPLTDEQLARMMMNDGVRLSRRTIAKYRDQMRIPGSRERRKII